MNVEICTMLVFDENIDGKLSQKTLTDNYHLRVSTFRYHSSTTKIKFDEITLRVEIKVTGIV